MLSEVHIQNYRSLFDVRIRLTPLTVIVGANGAGKSSLLRALTAERLADEPSFGGGGPTRRTMVTVTGKRTSPVAPANFEGQLLDLRLDRLREENRLDETTRLSTSGNNLANVLRSIGRRRLEELAHEFVSVVPLYADVDPRPTRNGHHEIRFQDRWNSSTWYRPAQVSDGSFLALSLLALRYQEPRPSLVAIEDPDRGLHPYLYQQLITRLRDFAGDGKKTRVVISTHNPSLLDCVDLDEVRFIRRNSETGHTELTEITGDEEEWRQFFAVHDDRLGDAWLTGALGGVPSVAGPEADTDTEAAEE